MLRIDAKYGVPLRFQVLAHPAQEASDRIQRIGPPVAGPASAISDARITLGREAKLRELVGGDRRGMEENEIELAPEAIEEVRGR